MTLRASSTMDGGVFHEYGVTNDGEYACTATAKACPIPSGEATAPTGWGAGATHTFNATLQPGTSSFLRSPVRLVKEFFEPSEGWDSCWYEEVPDPTAEAEDPALDQPLLVPTSREDPWPVGGAPGFPNRWAWDTIGIQPGHAWVIGWYRGDPLGFDADGDGTPDVSDSSPPYDLYDAVTVGPNGIPGDGDELGTPALLTGSCGWVYLQHMSIQCPGPTWVEYQAHPIWHTIYPIEFGVGRASGPELIQTWP